MAFLFTFSFYSFSHHSLSFYSHSLIHFSYLKCWGQCSCTGYTSSITTKLYWLFPMFENRAIPGNLVDQRWPKIHNNNFLSVQGCTIDWKQDKNVTVKIIKKKQKHKTRVAVRTVTKSVPRDSFFNFFNPPAGNSDRLINRHFFLLLLRESTVKTLIYIYVSHNALYFLCTALLYASRKKSRNKLSMATHAWYVLSKHVFLLGECFFYSVIPSLTRCSVVGRVLASH